jgi:hypothetical protein
MAKGKTGTKNVSVTVRAASPLARRSSVPRTITRYVKVKSRRKHGGGGGGILAGAATHSQILAPAIGGFAVAKLEDSSIMDSLPTLPLLGKKGTACLAIHLFRPHATGILRDIKIALAVMSGYELGKNGEISGPFAGGPFA